MKKIYVVMLTCNRKEETLRCLSGLSRVQVKDYKLETILVDNASQDGTTEEIKKRFSKVRLILNKQNRGFAAAVNQGLKLALKDNKTEFALLLNNDTFLNKIFVEKLTKTAKRENTIGIVAPALKHYQGEKLLYGMEGHLDLNKGKTWHRNIRNIKSSKIINADFVSGCCFLVKREILEKVGLLDEKYYLYLEDVDYCLRARKAGFKVVLDPKTVIGHKVSGSLKNPLSKLPHSFKSNIVLILKWTPFLYKPLAILRCLYFYPALAIIWSLPMLKRKIQRWLRS